MKVLLIGIGGTIAMNKENSINGGIPNIDANIFLDKLEGCKKLDSCMEIEIKSFCNIPSGSLDFDILKEVLEYAKSKVDSGISAVVITQGTDTIEESSFFCNLFWDKSAPLIFTGAMKMEDEFGYDGLANISASITLCKSLEAKNRGVLVVFGDRIFSANWVKKTYATFLDAFCGLNLEGVIIENLPRFFAKPLNRMTFKIPKQNKKILFLEQNLDENNDILDFNFTNLNFSGIVINGFGSGHISSKNMDKISKLNIPIIVSSRVSFGFTTKNTYGYAGSEIDLQNNGAIMSGMLDGRRARILLWCILGNNLPLVKFTEFEKSITIS